MSPDQLVAEVVAQYNQTIADIGGRLGNAAMEAASLREVNVELRKQNAKLQEQNSELQEKLKAVEAKKKPKGKNVAA